MSPPATTASLNECIVGSRCLITTRRHASRESFSRPPVEPTRVIPQQLLLRLRLQARPTEDMVDRVREVAFGVWIIGRIHQDIVPQKAGDAVEHVLAFVHFDATEEPAPSEIVAWPVLERRRASHVGGLFVHPPRPERKPPEAAF